MFKPKSLLSPLLLGTVLRLNIPLSIEAIQNERRHNVPLFIEAIQAERRHLIPLQIESLKTLRLAVPLMIEADGEPEGSFGHLFNIFRSGEPHLTHFFNIQSAPPTNPIEHKFDIYEGANALNVTFDIFSESLRGLLSDDVQRPIAEVEIKS